jgi:hypothetical protein
MPTATKKPNRRVIQAEESSLDGDMPMSQDSARVSGDDLQKEEEEEERLETPRRLEENDDADDIAEEPQPSKKKKPVPSTAAVPYLLPQLPPKPSIKINPPRQVQLKGQVIVDPGKYLRTPTAIRMYTFPALIGN